MKKVVLAYSGGLDTTFCLVYLRKKMNCEVHSVLVDTGGFSDGEIYEIEKRSLELGAASHKTIGVKESLYQDCLRYLIFGNVLRGRNYPLCVSAERFFQAKTVAEYAIRIKADAVAHGSTGAGNDQIRFDMAFHSLIPNMEIITPIRDLSLSRQQTVDYLKTAGIVWPKSKKKYSINVGLWGTTVGGTETLTSRHTLPEEAWPTAITEFQPQTLKISFSNGEPVAVNDQSFSHSIPNLIHYLNDLGGSYGIGRDIHVGDTILGIKGRVGFSAPAAVLLIQAHHYLEKHVLGKWQMYWKNQLGEWYGMMLHEGAFPDPVMRDIESFLQNSQSVVTGDVWLTLSPKHVEIEGIQSEYDLMNIHNGLYGEKTGSWTGDETRAFAKLLANSSLTQSMRKDAS